MAAPAGVSGMIAGATIVALLVSLLVFPAGPAVANMGNPFTEGSPGGEPTGLEQIAIEHESLEIDLRPLANAESARITATYAVRNDGGAKVLPLVFVAASLDAASRPPSITLDGAAVAITSVRAVDAPTSWQAPRTTPGIGEDAGYTYVVRKPSGLRFDLPLAPGRHAIRAEYAATPSKAALTDSPLVYWQLAYILAPARQWAGFGGLDVTVRLPPGWSAASRPALARSGDVLGGSFREIPADALALTAQAPIPPTPNTQPVVALALLAGAALAAWLAGGWLGRRGRGSRWAAPLSLVAGGASVVAAGLVLVPPSVDVPGQTSYLYGYGAGYTVTLLAPFAFGAGAVAAQVLAFVACRRAGARRS